MSSLYYASRFVRAPGSKPRRTESIGFSRLATALSVVCELAAGARPGESWICTTLIDGAHVPAVVGRGSGGAALIAAGVYDLERGS